MSRIIEQIATVQFQVQTRQASATMQALQEAAKDLARDMDSVNEKIAALGKDVPKDNPQLLDLQQQLRGIKKDYDDVIKAQRDFMRGAKAADQLWKAAQEQNIESLSFRSIKSGISGLRKRQEGLSAGDAKDMQDWRIIQNVIQEADRIVKEATADVQNTIQVIRDGGKVSEQAMRQTINALRDLRSSVDETDADFYKWGSDLDFMEGKLKEFTDAQRRARGEMVDANDARREALKLTKEGAEAAKKERDAADEKIASLKKEGEELIKNRELIKQNIEATRKEIDEQHKLIEKKHSELAAAEGARKIIFDADRAHIEGLQTQAEKERALANEKSDAAEKQMRYTELLQQQTDKLGQKVVSLQEKLAKLNEQKPTPNPVLEGLRHEAEVADSAIAQLEARLKELRSKDRIPTPTAEDAIGYTVGIPGTKGGNETIQRALQNQFSDAFASQDEATVRAFLRTAGFTGVYDRDSMSHYRDLSKKDMISQMTEYINNRFGGYNVDDDTYGIASGGKYHDMDWLEEVTEKERQKFMELSYEKQKAWVERVIKKQFGEIDAIIYQGADDASAYVGKGDAPIAGLKSVMNAEMWKGGKSESAATQAETEAQQKLIASTKELIQNNDELAKTEHLLETAKKGRKDIDEKIAAAQAQSTTATQEENQATETQEELEGQLTETQKQHKASQEQLNKEREKSAKLQGEAIEQDNKAAAAEGKVADATSKATEAQAKHNKKMEEGLQDVKDMENAQTDMQIKLDGQEQQLKENGEAYSKNAQDTAKAEADKRQAQGLTIQRMEEIKALLEQENRETVPANTEKWRENEAEIARLNQVINEAKGEWMSYADAMSIVDKIGKDGFVSTDQQMKLATDAINRQREATVKLIQEKERMGEETVQEREQLTQLDSALSKIKTGFSGADDVIARFNQHLEEPAVEKATQQTEKLAQTLDEKLAAATSVWDEDIRRETENLDGYEKKIKEVTDDISNMEAELEKLEQKKKNRSVFGKLKDWIGGEDLDYEISDLKARLNGDDFYYGRKKELEDLNGFKANAQEWLEYYKQQKAEALGLNEAEEQLVQTEEKLQKKRRMTTDDLKEGIKILEAEAAAQDRSTEGGQKRWEELQQVIAKMNQELKEATGEWMTFKQAEELAANAGKEGFSAPLEQIKKASDAISRQREELIKSIKAKRDNKNATDEEKAALEKEEAELEGMTKKLRMLKYEQDNFNISQEKMQMLMEKPRTAVNLDELKNAIKRADDHLRLMQGSLGENSKEYQVFAEQVRNAKNQLKEMEGQAKASATAWEKAWSRLKTYVVMYMGFNAVWQKMVGTADDLMQLSDKMGEVRKTTGFTADEVGRLAENLKRLDVRTNLTDLMTIAAKAGQLGLKTEQDVMGFTEAANKLMIALPEMGAEAATEMMKVAIATGEVKKIQDQINKGLIEGTSATEVALSKVGSTIDQLRANSAAAAPQITDFVKRVGAVGAQSGISIDQVAALGATVDALGMRVEMSATALSRMIPAIKNNAFAVANAIGMAPNALREMFNEAGGGMEAMLAIFQHIKDAGMDADSIENMLGMGGLKDVMKELNQQGARAGIVFAGLSQNVDELRRNLGTAKEAYEDNIAILQEYNKMNETTAAKWERLKNQIEEFFVGNRSNNMLGGFIDDLRWIIDLLTGEHGVGVALRTIIVYITAVNVKLFELAVGGLKSTWTGIRNIGVALGFVRGEMTKMQWANIFTALAAAIYIAYKEISNMKSALDKASESIGKAKEEAALATERFDGYWQKLKSTSEALIQAKANHEKLSAEVDKLRKSTDGSAESTANLKKKEDELETSEKNVTRASNDHKSAIAQINNIYGKYLGFILTEANYSNLAAAAHDKVTAAIEREILMKQKQAAIGEVDSKYSQEIATGYGELNERLVNYAKLTRSEAAKAMSDMQKFMRENMKYDAGLNKTVVSKAIIDQLKKSKLDVSNADANEIAALWFDNYLRKNFHLSDNIRAGVTGVRQGRNIKGGWSNVYNLKGANLRGDYAETYAEREQERGALANVYGVDLYDLDKKEGKASATLLKNLEKTALDAKKKILDKNVNDKERNAAYGELANALEALDNRIDELDPKKDAATINRLNEMAKSLKGEGIDIKRLKKAREIIHQTLFERATFNEEDIKNIDTTNPWGSSHEASSTDWKNMTAEQLVNRRKQMKDFVNAIQTDSDVKTVLAEDAALKKAIEKGMSSDMRTVIEWYNTERLKIQDELHARHLTNTGDWKDPKKGGRKASKMVQDEMKYYLDELDAYYTDRKAKIQEARNDEQITEAEAWRRTLQNDAEWQQRRGELQELYTKKSEKVTKESKDRILDILSERTGDSASYILKDIANTVKFIEKVGVEKGKPAMDRIWGDIDLGIEQAFLRQRNAIGKQMDAIAEIINKERPFNGITKNLQENLTKMGILQADFEKQRLALAAKGEDTKELDKKYEEDIPKRLAFILGEAENAWTTSVEEIMKRMADAGMTAWADEIRKSPKMQEALIAQLHNTYDQIQEAIKKEASLMKKQAENMWNNILLPGGDGKTTVKDAFEKAIAQLGLDQGRVSRANSLINAGPASERVADKLAIKQMKLQLTMQEHYFNLMKKQGQQRVDDLTRQIALAKEEKDIEKAKRLEQDKQHVIMSLRLATTKEQTTLLKQQEEIIAKTEESQNRLYKELKEWADLLASSMQSLFEASNAGNAEYYNERARIALEGEAKDDDGKVKVERYVIIEDAGTSDAEAHYEELTELQKIEREREIEQQNAQAEAWKKVMDDINMKMSETITDYMNSFLQNEYIDKNTQALYQNTMAIDGLIAAMGGKASNDFTDAGSMARDKSGMALDDSGNIVYPIQPTEGEEAAKPLFPTSPEDWEMTREQMGETFQLAGEKMLETNEMLNEAGVKPLFPQPMTDDEVAKIIDNNALITEAMTEQTINAGQTLQESGIESINPKILSDEEMQAINDQVVQMSQVKIDTSNKETAAIGNNAKKQTKEVTSANNQTANSTQSTFAKMAAAANMYGIAYQTMSNDNLSTAQKVEMFALQAAGQAAIAMLTTDMIATEGKTTVQMPGIFGKLMGEMPYWAALAAYAGITATMGGLMALAMSSVSKSKSQIAQATGASTSSNAKSISAGKLMTGMLTYGEGNVNEFTDPSSLTPGRSYNVDSADGKTYRAKYMGADPKTHLTNGAEFHLVGERGREAIIDAHTTRLLQMDDTGIWQAIQTLYNGGSLRHSVMRRKGRGMAAFADGNIDEFETMADGGGLMAGGAGFSPEQMMALQASIDRQSDLLERAMTDGIHAYFDVYGRGGLIDSYDTGKKTVTSHGERY